MENYDRFPLKRTVERDNPFSKPTCNKRIMKRTKTCEIIVSDNKLTDNYPCLTYIYIYIHRIQKRRNIVHTLELIRKVSIRFAEIS